MEITVYLAEPNVFFFRCELSIAHQWKLYIKIIYKQRLFVNTNLVLEEFKRILLFKIEIEKKILIKQDKFSLYTKYHPLYENLKESDLERSRM